jgi:hypothetical protein
MRKSVKVAVATGATLALGAGVAFATVPDSKGVIHGCRNIKTGVLRAVDYPTHKCASTERGLNWNYKGPTGPRGPQGIPGVIGHTYVEYKYVAATDPGGTYIVTCPNAGLVFSGRSSDPQVTLSGHARQSETDDSNIRIYDPHSWEFFVPSDHASLDLTALCGMN